MSYVHWIRSLVGQRKIFLVFATVVVTDDAGRILLQYRTDFNLWGLPGGVLELNEDILSCARRELVEETGLQAGELRLVGIYTDPRYDVIYPNGDEVQQYTICFACRRHGGVMRPDGIETSKQGFFEPSDVAGMEIPPWYRAMIQDAIRGGPPAFSAPHADENRADQFGAIGPLIGPSRVIAVGAFAAVRRDDGRLLAVVNSSGEGWDLPGGLCDIGENAAYTVQRQTLDKTGLHIMPESVIAVFSACEFMTTWAGGEAAQMVGTFFRTHVLGGQLKRFDGGKACADWLAPAELLANASDQCRSMLSTSFPYVDDGWIVS